MFFRSCFMVAKRQSKLTTFLGYVFRSKKAVDPRSENRCKERIHSAARKPPENKTAKIPN